MGIILGIIIGICLIVMIYACLCSASDADDRAEIMRDFEEEK